MPEKNCGRSANIHSSASTTNLEDRNKTEDYFSKITQDMFHNHKFVLPVITKPLLILTFPQSTIKIQIWLKHTGLNNKPAVPGSVWVFQTASLSFAQLGQCYILYFLIKYMNFMLWKLKNVMFWEILLVNMNLWH